MVGRNIDSAVPRIRPVDVINVDALNDGNSVYGAYAYENKEVDPARQSSFYTAYFGMDFLAPHTFVNLKVY